MPIAEKKKISKNNPTPQGMRKKKLAQSQQKGGNTNHRGNKD